MNKVDYLIVGQGIAGTLLSLELIKANKKIAIVNFETENTASNKAGGLYNPITGRKMVKTWMADELFADLENYYQSIENLLNVSFLEPKRIYRPFFSVEEQNDWQGKAGLSEYKDFIFKIHTQSRQIEGLNDPFGGLELNKSGSVDLPKMISAARQFFKKSGAYTAARFDYEKIQFEKESLIYENISASKIIFCEGPEATKNPFLKDLPFRPVKGEVIDVTTDLQTHNIINRGVFMLPKENFFRIGSTYDHQSLDFEPTEAGKKNICDRLEKIYQKPYKIVNHRAGVRPATYDRRPFIGLLKNDERLGVFNGFGTKGVSLVPFFTTQYINYLSGHGELDDAVNIERLNRI